MKQLLLELDANRPQTLESFVTGQHAELVALLHRFAQRAASSFGERAVYIWGDAGAGKSHLLHALELDATARYINPATPLAEFDHDSTISLYLLDDCQDFDELQQIAAFNLYNQVKEQSGYFVAAGTAPPARLAVREDLRTRLGWGLIYQLQGLTDQEKIAALEHAANARGVTLPSGVLPYLITHFRRDMPSLTGMLNAVIDLSLEIKHPVTLPFLRDVIQQQKTSNE